MPIYEFYSPDNNRVYSFLARSLAEGRKMPRCPDNQAYRMERMVSAFAVTGKARETTAPVHPPTGMPDESDDPRMEQAMNALESEFTSLDEENPDPRRLGHLMRRMSELTGEALPPAMQEMVTRMERGEDPEKLEEEYGEVLDAEEPFGGDEERDGPPSSVPDGPTDREAKPKRRKRPALSRDPHLYEMADYV